MKKMSSKMVGSGLMVVGIIAVILYFVITGKLGEEMGKVNALTGTLSHGGQGGRMAGSVIESRANDEAAGYLQGGRILLIGGIIAVIVGGYIVFFRKK
jgi:hypothetical protein